MNFFEKILEMAKSMGVKNFAYYKKWALDHLKKQLDEEETVTKALEYCEEYLEKAYGVGTIRTWKGKKYIKGPDKKWRRYYEKHDRGANQAIKNIMREINSLENGDVEGLYAIIQKNQGRFRDGNGNILPEVQQIHDLVDKKQSGSEKQNSDIEKYKKLQDELKQEIADGKRNNTKELQEDVNEWKNLLSIAEKRPGSYSKEQTEHFREIIKIGEAELKRREEKEDAKELQINVDGVKNAIKDKSETEVKKYFNWAEKRFADKPEDSIERRAIAQAKKEYFGYDTNIAKGLESVADTSKVNKNIKNTTVESFCGKDQQRFSMTGVYNDPDGYKVATDGHYLYAEKADISEENSGKITYSNGVTAEGNYPNWKRVVPENAPKTEIFDNRKQLIQLCLVGNKISKLNGKAPCFVKVGKFFFNTDYLNRVLSIAEKQDLNDVSITDNGQVIFKGEKGVATTLPMIDFNAGTNSYLDATDRMYYGDQSDAVKEFLGTKANVENPNVTEEPKRETTEEKESPEVAAKNKEFEKYGYRIKKMPDGTWAAGYKKEDGSWLDGGLRLNAPTMEDAASYIQSEINRKEESKELEAKEKAAKEKAENQKREVEAGYGTFFSGKDAKTKAREINHLEKRVNFGNGKIQSYKEYIEEQFKNGDLEIGTHEENKLKGPSRRAYNRMDGRQQEEYERRIQAAGKKTVYEIKSKSEDGYYDLGKIAYDYAKFLIEKGGIKKSFLEQIEEISKSVNGEKQSEQKHNLEYYKKWAMSILDKQKEEPEEDGPNEETIVKALAYTEMIAKAGYPVGTIREWKGKKYIKVASNQWKPKYDKINRGAKMSLSHLKKAVANCNSEEELYNLINTNASRFRDENGHPLPEVQELHDIVSKRQAEMNNTGDNGGNAGESAGNGESAEVNGSEEKKEDKKKTSYAEKIAAIQKLGKKTDNAIETTGSSGRVDKVAENVADDTVNAVKTAVANKEKTKKNSSEMPNEKPENEMTDEEKESFLKQFEGEEKTEEGTVTDSQTTEKVLSKYMGDNNPGETRKREGNKETVWGNDYTKKHKLEFKQNMAGVVLGKPQMDQELFEELSKYDVNSDSYLLAPKYGLEGAEFLNLVSKVREDRVNIVDSGSKNNDEEGTSNQAENDQDKRVGSSALWDQNVKNAIKTGDANQIKSAIAKVEKEYAILSKRAKTENEKEFLEYELKYRKRDAENALKELNTKTDGGKKETFESLTEKYNATKDPDEREKILNEMMNLDRQDEEKILPAMFDKEDEGFAAWDKDQKEKYGNKSVEELQKLLDTKYKDVKKYTPEYSEAMKIGDMIQQKKRQK